MPDFEAMYFQLFNAMTDILTQLEQQNYGQAKQLLITAQQQAEQQYLDAEEKRIPAGAKRACRSFVVVSSRAQHKICPNAKVSVDSGVCRC